HRLVRTPKQLERVLSEVEQSPGVVLYTVVKKELTDFTEKRCEELKVPSLHVLSPIMEVIEAYLTDSTRVPSLPPQGAGPHFMIRKGRIEFAPLQELDAEGNYLPTLTSL